jgi:hypothetical protein
MARDKTITITSFSAGQTNTRAKKGFRMSSLLNVELDNIQMIRKTDSQWKLALNPSL